MPYKLIRESRAGAKPGDGKHRDTKADGKAKAKHKGEEGKAEAKHKGAKTGDKGNEAKADTEPGGAKAAEGKPEGAKPGEAKPPDAKADAKRPHDVFLDNEWTQLVLKALHRTLQKVEARCGVSKRLVDASSDDDADGKPEHTDDAKELKDATLAAWAELAGTVPHLDTAANYVLGMYLHTLAPPDVDFVVLLPRLPPWEVVLLAFVNNMHDNRPALVKYWTLPLRLKTRVLADNLTSVMKKLVGPCMKRVRTDGTREAASEDEDDPPVRTVYLDEAHPLSKGAGK